MSAPFVSPTSLWNDPLNRRIALGVIGELVISGQLISGLMQRARDVDLDKKLASWIGMSGENQSFSPSEIKQVVDPEMVEDLKKELKLSEKDLFYRLARIVPQIASQVLPAGESSSPDIERIGLEAIRSNLISSSR